MKKSFLVFGLVLLAGLLLFGCMQTQLPAQKTYVCSNGVEVVNKDDCAKLSAPVTTPTTEPTTTPVALSTATPTYLPTFTPTSIPPSQYVAEVKNEVDAVQQELNGINSVVDQKT